MSTDIDNAVIIGAGTTFGKMIARLRARSAQVAPNDSQERFGKLGIDVLRGEAAFASPPTCPPPSRGRPFFARIPSAR